MAEPVFAAAALANPEQLIEIANRLGIIESVKTKLVSQPDKAATKLAVVRSCT